MYLHNLIFNTDNKHIDILILKKGNNYYFKYSNLFIKLNDKLLIEKIIPYKGEIINLLNYQIVKNITIINKIKELLIELPKIIPNNFNKNYIEDITILNDYDKFIYETIKLKPIRKNKKEFKFKLHNQLV